MLRALVVVGLLVAAAHFASAATAAPRLCMSADTLSFGEQPVGSSRAASVSVANCGEASLSFTDVSAYAGSSTAFRVETSCATGMTLAPGDACDATVHFEPSAPGQVAGALWFHNTTANPDQLLTFYGRGIDTQAGTASLAFSPAAVDFGGVALGSETPALVLTLTNRGAASLVPARFVLNGATPYDFRGELGNAGGDCGTGRAIAAGASCTLSLYFRPQAAGARSATLVIDAPQLATLAFVPLYGVGVTTAATIEVVEFRNADDGQYFITGDAREMALLDAGAIGSGWSRTGAAFAAWPADATGGDALPVCRFFGTPGVGPASHLYTAYDNECALVRHDPRWIEEGATFSARLPVDGACAAGDATVVRLWKPGADVTQSRHRYVVDPALVPPMQSDGWVLEGPVFCAPPR
jgi:hypothetical protein